MESILKDLDEGLAAEEEAAAKLAAKAVLELKKKNRAERWAKFWKGLGTGFAVSVVVAFSIVVLLVLTIPLDIFVAWVLVKLWGWFVSTVWVPTLWQAFGVLYIVDLLKYKSKTYEEAKKKDEHPFKNLGYMLFSRALAAAASLGIGYLVLTLIVH